MSSTTAHASGPTRSPRQGSLAELALLFLRLGATAFGGPAAHVAILREELVVKRAWLSDERFLDLLSAANLIPGPNSTELAIHIGYERQRWRGLITAGVCFIAPAALLTGVLGALYVRLGAHPAAEKILYGLRPVLLAIVLQAVWSLAPKAMPNLRLRVLGALAFGLSLLQVNELALLLAAGLVQVPLRRAALGVIAIVPSASLFGVFLKVGSALFGSGYVLLSLLRSELVVQRGWLDEKTLLDAIVVGQVTPGPLFTSATFIGYLLRGPWGALVATVGIFMPAFVLVAASAPFVARMRSAPDLSAFLDGVNAASVALMAAVLVQTVHAAVVDLPSAALALVSAVLTIHLRVNTLWLVLLGSLVGLTLR
ncbi:MAG TPA: chromate transporter [Polyangiales bacterium]|nr:chromate transporter [Polyangiales bacterium]